MFLQDLKTFQLQSATVETERVPFIKVTIFQNHSGKATTDMSVNNRSLFWNALTN